VHAAHPRHARVQRQQQVQALGLADLPDDQPVRPHPEGLLHQPAQGDLAGALQARLPGLHGHPVRGRRAQLEDLLDGDQPLPRGYRGQQRVERRRLAGLGAAGDEDAEAGDHGRFQEAGGPRGQRAEPDQVVDGPGADDELADVDGDVPAGDVRDHRVQPGAVRQGGVDERGADVEPAAAAAQHSLHQVADVGGSEDRGGQLAAAPPGDEDAARLVDPDLLDLGVVQPALQRAEAGDRVEHGPPDPSRVGDRWQRRGQHPLRVVRDDLVDQRPGLVRRADRVQPAPPHQLAYLVLDRFHSGPHVLNSTIYAYSMAMTRPGGR